MDKDDIINYYRDCKKDYQWIWRLDKVWGIHFGYFEEGGKSLSQAILKMNDQIIKHAEISEDSLVLDAGCGYAGTAMYIAERKKAHIEAITIVDEQVETGSRIIKEKGLDEYVNITEQDFTATDFADNTFDVVYGIESICHAFDKRDFLKEAYRVLKPGGCLIILDGFNAREKDEYSARERKQLENFNHGWAVESLESAQYFIRESKALGFVSQEYENLTDRTIKTSRILYIASFPAYVVDLFGRLFGKRTRYGRGNVVGARYQYIGLKKHLWEYGCFKAVKSPDR